MVREESSAVHVFAVFVNRPSKENTVQRSFITALDPSLNGKDYFEAIHIVQAS